MILDRGSQESVNDKYKVSTNIREQVSRVSASERQTQLGQRPATVWLTGLPKAGKTTISYALERHLFDKGIAVHVLDGENLRHGISKNLSFSPLDRSEHIRRAANLARLCNDAGLMTIVALVSPYQVDRQEARNIIGDNRFLEVHIDAPVATCESRDSDGLYAAARKGDIEGFTGISAPYEAPASPDLHIDSSSSEVDQSVQSIVDLLQVRELLA